MILLVGGTGYVGQHLAPRLQAGGEQVRCLVRPHCPPTARQLLESRGFEVCAGDLEDAESLPPACAGARLVISLAHIRLAPALLACAPAATERLVLLSSQRGQSEVASDSVAAVRAGERLVAAAAHPTVILRPTMIFGPGDDRNISRIAAFVRRHGWFPIIGSGRALQQPVYVGDVVDAILAAVEGRGRNGLEYSLAGAEPLPFDQLVNLVGQAVGRRPLKVHIPVWLAVPALRAARAAGLRLPLDAEQAQRLQEDKSCSIAAARRDLNYAPMSFAAGLRQSYPRRGAGEA